MSRIITAVSCAVLAAVFLYSLFGIIASESLHFRLSDYERFEYFQMTNPGTVQSCSTLPVFASITEVRTVIMYGGDTLGSMHFGPVFLVPGAVSEQEAAFSPAELSSVQYILLAIDSQNSKTSPVRINPALLTIVTDTQSRILGLFPFTVQKTYSGYEFSNMMNSGAWC